MSKEQDINRLIKTASEFDTNLISDGYHTFGELYDHRISLFIALCKMVIVNLVTQYAGNEFTNPVWKSMHHSDGSVTSGWFILGLYKNKGDQITYHLPLKYWDECEFADTLHKAPEFDGHTSQDVLLRLKNITS